MSNDFIRINESVLSVVNGTQEDFLIEEEVLNEILENLTEEEIDHIDSLYEQYENGDITEEELEKKLEEMKYNPFSELGQARIRSKIDDWRKKSAQKKDQKADLKKNKELARVKELRALMKKRNDDRRSINTFKQNTKAKNNLVSKEKEDLKKDQDEHYKKNPTQTRRALNKVGNYLKSKGDFLKSKFQKTKNDVAEHYEQEYGITLTEEEATNLIFNYILEEKMNKENK